MAAKKAHSPKNSTKIRENIIKAALETAAQEPWEFVSLLTIAEKAGLELNDVTAHFADKAAILTTITDDLDTEVEAAFPDIDETIPLRDRLFDVVMERIDVANRHRDAHISFFKAFGWTKESACADVTLLKGSMIRMAKCAGMDTGGLFGGLRLTGLGLAYSWVLLTWMRDTSPDLGKTMAELDRTLGRVEKLADYLKI